MQQRCGGFFLEGRSNDFSKRMGPPHKMICFLKQPVCTVCRTEGSNRFLYFSNVLIRNRQSLFVTWTLRQTHFPRPDLSISRTIRFTLVCFQQLTLNNALNTIHREKRREPERKLLTCDPQQLGSWHPHYS